VYDLYLTRTLKHAELVRAKVGGAAAGIPVFIDQKLDAAAGVREPDADLDAGAVDVADILERRILAHHIGAFDDDATCPRPGTARIPAAHRGAWRARRPVRPRRRAARRSAPSASVPDCRN